MKPIRDQELSQQVIPDGEGFNALPVSFNPHPYPSRKRTGELLER